MNASNTLDCVAVDFPGLCRQRSDERSVSGWLTPDSLAEDALSRTTWSWRTGLRGLRGATTRERAPAPADIAHPKFRDELERSAREVSLL